MILSVSTEQIPVTDTRTQQEKPLFKFLLFFIDTMNVSLRTK